MEMKIALESFEVTFPDCGVLNVQRRTFNKAASARESHRLSLGATRPIAINSQLSPLMHYFILSLSLSVALSHWHLWDTGVLFSFEWRGSAGPQPSDLQWPVFQIIKIEENLLKLIILLFIVQIHNHWVLFCSSSSLFHTTFFAWLIRTALQENCYSKWHLGHVAFEMISCHLVPKLQEVFKYCLLLILIHSTSELARGHCLSFYALKAY